MRKTILLLIAALLISIGTVFAQSGTNKDATVYATLDSSAPTSVGTEGDNLILWGDITGNNYVYLRIYSKDFVNTKEYSMTIEWDTTQFEIEDATNDILGFNVGVEGNIYGTYNAVSKTNPEGYNNRYNIWGNTTTATTNNGLLTYIKFKIKDTAARSGTAVFRIFNVQALLSVSDYDKLAENAYGGTAVTIAAVQDAGPIIPVELSTFTVTNVSTKDMKLEWTTASETNNYGFEIERSNDGEIFTKIGFVEGNGTTNNMNTYTYVDENLTSGSYYYRLKQVDFDGTFSYSEVVKAEVQTPDDYGLGQNYPNPFNPETTIPFSIKEAGRVKINVYNILGQEVAEIMNKELNPGYYSVNFNASRLVSGMYFYRMTVNGKSFLKKFVLVK